MHSSTFTYTPQQLSLAGVTTMIVVRFQLLHFAHDLDSTSQLDSQALDQRLMGQQKQGDTVHLLVNKQVHIAFAIRGGLEVLHHL